MGYDFHITRKKFYFDEGGPVITPDEWLALVGDDPELEFTTEENDPYFVLWNGDSKWYPYAWMSYNESSGDIYTKNPDEPLIEKMVQIAQRLEAKVQGDDGEVYLGGGQEPYEEM